MKALIETIVYPLVDHPDQIEVTVEETDEKIRYHLTVHSDDVGKVIGKNGRIAKSDSYGCLCSGFRYKQKSLLRHYVNGEGEINLPFFHFYVFFKDTLSRWMS